MRIVLAALLAVAVADSALAQTQPFYLHHSATPVAIPGGTTQSFLDGLAPTAPTPLAEEQVIASGNTASFATFTTPAFASDTSLLPIASVRVHLAANAKMHGCGSFTTDLFKVDSGGGLTAIGSGTVTSTDVAQGSSGGTAGATSHLVEFPLGDTGILTGQGLALATSFTNQCNINRRVFFAYDGLTAPSRVRFQCCVTIAAKCGSLKIKAVAALSSCLLGVYGSAAGHGDPLDPAHLAKCADRADTAFAKAEERGGCLTLGDAPARISQTETFANGLDGALYPVAHETRCQGSKLKLVAKASKCLLALEAKAAETGQFLEPDPVKAEKCRTSMTLGFGKLEGKAGNDCDTTGDAAATLASLGAFESQVSSDLSCPCPP